LENAVKLCDENDGELFHADSEKDLHAIKAKAGELGITWARNRLWFGLKRVRPWNQGNDLNLPKHLKFT
jgi:hypothetical protein